MWAESSRIGTSIHGQDHALRCFSNDELQKIPKGKRKKIALGGACSIRIGVRNYVVRAGKTTGAKAWTGDSAVVLWSGLATRDGRQGVCRSERMERQPSAGSMGGQRAREKANRPSSQARPGPSQLRGERWIQGSVSAAPKAESGFD